MRKRIVKVFITLVLLAGGATSVVYTAQEASACNSCDTSNENRKCGNCESSKLTADSLWVANDGKLHTIWKCTSCGHSFETKRSGGKEVFVRAINTGEKK